MKDRNTQPLSRPRKSLTRASLHSLKVIADFSCNYKKMKAANPHLKYFFEFIVYTFSMDKYY